MLVIVEAHQLERKWRKLPPQVLKKYELWKSVVRYNGPMALRQFPGFRDEFLKGAWAGYRSSRLNLQYRVVYSVVKGMVVRVEDIMPHTY